MAPVPRFATCMGDRDNLNFFATFSIDHEVGKPTKRDATCAVLGTDARNWTPHPRMLQDQVKNPADPCEESRPLTPLPHLSYQATAARNSSSAAGSTARRFTSRAALSRFDDGHRASPRARPHPHPMRRTDVRSLPPTPPQRLAPHPGQDSGADAWQVPLVGPRVRQEHLAEYVPSLKTWLP